MSFKKTRFCNRQLIINTVRNPNIPNIPEVVDTCANLIPRNTIKYILKQGSVLSADEKKQIRENYQSNIDTEFWYNEVMMTNKNYWFTLAVEQTNLIIGQAGIDKLTYELRDDVVSKEWQGKGVYTCLINARINFVKTDTNINDRTYFLLTDKLDESVQHNAIKNIDKIKKHVDSGLIHLEKDLIYEELSSSNYTYTSEFLQVGSTTEYITVRLRNNENLIAFYINPLIEVPIVHDDSPDEFIATNIDSDQLDDKCTCLIARSVINYQLKQGSHLSEEEKIQIKTNYKNNTESNDDWYNSDKMITDDYWFVLAVKTGGDEPTNLIMGQMGIDTGTYELRDECVNKTFKDIGLLQCLFNSRAIYVRQTEQLNNVIYYYFIDRQNETHATEGDANKLLNLNVIKNQMEAGLVQLDHDVNGDDNSVANVDPKGKYVTSFNKRGSQEHVEYVIAPTDKLIAFRTPGYYEDAARSNYKCGIENNYISYGVRGGMCSGLYIGNGLIVSAGHCHIEDWSIDTNPMDMHNVNFVNKQSIVTISNTDRQRIFYDQPDRVIGNMYASKQSFYIDLSIIDISGYLNDIPRDLEKVLICENPQNVPVDYNIKAWGQNSHVIRTNLVKARNIVDDAFQRKFNYGHLPSILIDNHPGFPTANPTSAKIELNKRITGVCATDRTNNLQQGDSGGPHFYVNNNNQSILIGTTGQRGFDLLTCNDYGTPDGYGDTGNTPIITTNFSMNLNWIKDRLTGAANPTVQNNKLFTIDYNTGLVTFS